MPRDVRNTALETQANVRKCEFNKRTNVTVTRDELTTELTHFADEMKRLPGHVYTRSFLILLNLTLQMSIDLE